MTAAKKPEKRRGAAKPAGRDPVVLRLSGAFEGWEATVRVDFPARVLEELNSGENGRVCRAFDRIMVTHNMPDAEANVADSLLDVEPLDFIGPLIEALGVALEALPPR